MPFKDTFCAYYIVFKKMRIEKRRRKKAVARTNTQILSLAELREQWEK